MYYAIKVHVADSRSSVLVFDEQKTMYGGKAIAAGDTIFVFDSENEGGRGLVARGLVTSAQAVVKTAGVETRTPRVSIRVKTTATATCTLGRTELKSFTTWNDGRPETELNFKFYRQATNKIVGLAEPTATFLEKHFSSASLGPGTTSPGHESAV